MDGPPPFRVITLDPHAVASAVQAGEPVTLPTMWGDATLSSFRRASGGVRVYEEGPAGELVDKGTHMPQVWKVESADGAVTGLLLADGKQVRATLLLPQGRSTIEPGLEGIPTGGVESIHRMYADEPTRNVVHAWEAPPVLQEEPPQPRRGPASMAVTKTMVAYVDDEFGSTWGGLTWPDHVTYLTSWVNTYMDDVQLTYAVNTMVKSDPGTTSSSAWSEGFDWISTRSNLGMNSRVFWSHVDYDGCTVGQAVQPGDYAMLQTTDDSCHLWEIVDTDFERAYLMAHELGHTNNGAHAPDCESCPWSELTWYGHRHREILYTGGNGHFHECWGSTNADRMRTHLGTTFVGTACS